MGILRDKEREIEIIELIDENDLRCKNKFKKNYKLIISRIQVLKKC